MLLEKDIQQVVRLPQETERMPAADNGTKEHVAIDEATLTPPWPMLRASTTSLKACWSV